MLTNLKKLFDPFHRGIDKKIEQFAKSLPKGSVVLNAGAGEGAYNRYFKHCEIIGIDLCVGDSSWDYSSVDIIGDLHNIPFNDNVFDSAICVVVLEHLHSPHIFFKELHRVLKPKGKVFFVFPFMWELHQLPNDYFRFTEFGFKRLAKDAGFSVVHIEKMGCFFRMMHYRTASFVKYALKKPLLLILLILFSPFIIFFMFFSEILDRMFQLCEHTLGYNSILQKE
jgi:SAM-dependent methyltransferase